MRVNGRYTIVSHQDGQTIDGEARLIGSTMVFGRESGAMHGYPNATIGQTISKIYTTPLFFKMAQNLDLRCVLVPAPWVLGPKHVSNPE